MMKMNEGNKKAGLKLNIQKNLDHSGWSQHFMANIWEKVKTVTDFIFFGLKTTVDSDRSHEIKRHLFLEINVFINLGNV